MEAGGIVYFLKNSHFQSPKSDMHCSDCSNIKMKTDIKIIVLSNTAFCLKTSFSVV